ncbi:NADH-quinone oxidoreductase subunit G [Helicobacter burdigaliensis]|nr:NADH-quinone oxidoreductase subunit G [Helicobacter burdigaliensis]
MDKVKLIIEGQEILANEGESILNAARANGVFIPAICYLSCSSPTLACKMCMVEADGKRVYACNAKVKEGMSVLVNTKEIEEERKAIMQAYDVNHPLQCGVCDKSGECELQNYTHYVGVNNQEYAMKDEYRSFDSWGQTAYDPNLCILCERCVTLCKDKIGKSYIKALKKDGEMPPKEYKESMPKDAFSVWTKFKKSIIGLSGEGECQDCGECASVCPVGALGVSHFQYSSNAWELSKIPSSCIHCANACALNYEVKHERIGGGKDKIYRVSSDWNFATLCPAGRFAYEFNHQGITKDKASFNATLAALKEAKSIKFLGNITNEEALILQKLREKHNYTLVCDEAFYFQQFLKEFKNVSGSLGSANQEEIKKSDFIMCFGGALSYDMPVITHSINNALKMNKGSNLAYFHTQMDVVVNKFVKSTNLINSVYKPQSEEAFALLLASLCIKEEKMPKSLKEEIKRYEIITKKTLQEEIKEKIKIQKLDENGEPLLDEKGEIVYEEKEEVKKISKEIEVLSSKILEYCQIGEEIFKIKEILQSAKAPVLVAGFDLYGTKNAINIARILGFIELLSDVKILLLPPSTNALGISLICELEREAQGYCIGYNTKGDYKIGYEEDNALILPYLNEQEGTFVNVDKRVVPINPAFKYEGYELNDLAKELGLECENTIDYTRSLPIQSGFKEVEYDSLEHGFLNDGSEIRGYLLHNEFERIELDIEKVELEPLEEFNLYSRNGVAHFSPLTLQSSILKSKNGLQVSQSMAEKLKLKENDNVEVEFANLESIATKVVIDEGMEGEFLALGMCEFDESKYFPQSRYAKATIKVKS